MELPANLYDVSDEEIERLLEAEMGRLTPRLRKFVTALSVGTDTKAAAEGARLSVARGPLVRAKKRASQALRLLAEQARRTTRLSLDAAVERFQTLSRDAQAAGDFGAAARSYREACLLVGLYPAERLKVDHTVTVGTDMTSEDWEALSLCMHRREDLKKLASGEVVDAEVLPALPAMGEGTPDVR